MSIGGYASLYEASQFNGTGDPLHADMKCRLAVGDAFGLGLLPYFAIGPRHNLYQLFADMAFLPTELLQVLGPLELGDDDPAGVDQYVRHDPDPAFSQYVVGFRG